MKHLVLLCFVGLVMVLPHPTLAQFFVEVTPEEYEQMSEQEQEEYSYNLRMQFYRMQSIKMEEDQKHWTEEQWENWRFFKHELYGGLTIQELAFEIQHEMLERCRRILLKNLMAIQANDKAKEAETMSDFNLYSCSKKIKSASPQKIE